MSGAASRSAVVVVLVSGCSFQPFGAGDDGVELSEGAGASAGAGSGGGGSDGPGPGDDTTGSAPDGCEDACEAGAVMCDEDGVVRCGAGDGGCREWLSPEPCAEGQVCSDGVCARGPGFMRAPAAWTVPDGGRTGEGFAAAAGQPAVIGDDAWELLDLDGDGALDLVRTADAYPVGGDAFVARNKGFPLAPYWEFHRSAGTAGFVQDPAAWLLPVAVGISGRGLTATTGEPLALGDFAWTLRDVDGDARPDLVVTGVQIFADEVAPLGPPAARRWDVYRNNGAGFEPVAQPWMLPKGPDSAFFHHVGGAAAVANGPAWSLLDLDGDGFSDIVVSGRVDWPDHVVPGFPGSPHWELHRGGPGGFATPMAPWSLPPGGGAQTGFVGGAEGLFGSADDVGDEAWALLDLDGDRRLELVVTGRLDDAAVGPVALTIDGAPAWAAHSPIATGFELSPRTVAIPTTGGGTGQRGFYAPRGGQDVAGVAVGPYDANGWELLDLDGDGRLDLVVTNEAREASGGIYKRSGLGGAAPYWDVYLGTDAGFVASARWPTPSGGFLGRGFLWTRGQVGPVPENEATVLWHTGDLDRDGRPELIVTGLAASNGDGVPWTWHVPGLADDAPHWQIHWQWQR